ncbi:hypothetical protein HJC23_013580 [Cyclotella cryptica]|uniref:Calcineurin-like phosphoesterase domain-containing protein n=1 Tax=Cyclotella cryptica TaxID=29204 RepID=A0ABD3PQV3_9STRA
MNDGTNALITLESGEFDDYDSIDGEFSIQMNNKGDDDSDMVMSELGSMMGGVSVAGVAATAAAMNGAAFAANAVESARNANGDGGLDGNDEELRRIKSEDSDPIFEDDNNRSYDTHADGASVVNSEMGISAGDVSAVLFGGRSDAYNGGSEGNGNYAMSGMSLASGLSNNLNTSVDDTVGDLFARDDDTAVDTLIPYANLQDLQAMEEGPKKRLGPLGDELSYAQDTDTDIFEKHAPSAGLQIHMNDDDSMLPDEIEEEELRQSGILPEWLSSSNPRMKSLIVISAAMIVGSFVMAVVALGANSRWWTNDSSANTGVSSGLDSALTAQRGGVTSTVSSVGVSSWSEVPSMSPSLLKTKKPTTRPAKTTKAPVSMVTGENTGSLESDDLAATTTTTIAAVTMTEATTTSTTVETVAPSNTIMPSTLSPIVSPTISPSSDPVTRIPTLTPTINPSDPPTIPPSTRTPSASPSDAPVTTAPTTLAPTSRPSSQPTMQPSVLPTVAPSGAPTGGPSKKPTMQPTVKPTTSMAPSFTVGSEAATYGDATFYLMADGATNVGFWREKLERLQVNQTGAKFLVHLGSTVRKVDDCLESAYAKAALSLQSTPVSAYALPGNFDWPLCTNSTRGLNLWRTHFASIERTVWGRPVEYVVRRQMPSRPENFAFLWKRVMFIGLHVVQSGNANETSTRIQDNLDWVNENVANHFHHIDVIFIMGHGRLMASDNLPFYDGILNKKLNEWKDKYIIYARRASGTGVLTNVAGLDKFDELRVGAKWPILDVQISTAEGDETDSGSSLSSAVLRYRQVKDPMDVPV